METRIEFLNLPGLSQKIEWNELIIFRKSDGVYVIRRGSKKARAIGLFQNPLITKGNEGKGFIEVYVASDELSKLRIEKQGEEIKVIKFDLNIRLNGVERVDYGEETLLIVEKEEYKMIKGAKLFKGKIEGKCRGLKVFEAGGAFIITTKGIYLIKEGKKAYIEGKLLEEKGFNPKSIKGWAKTEDFLFLFDGKKILMVSIKGEKMFYFSLTEGREEKRKELENFKI